MAHIRQSMKGSAISAGDVCPAPDARGASISACRHMAHVRQSLTNIRHMLDSHLPTYGTCETVKARSWRWPAGQSHHNFLRCSIFARKWNYLPTPAAPRSVLENSKGVNSSKTRPQVEGHVRRHVLYQYGVSKNMN